MTDLRYAVRQLRKNPGFTAVAVLTLGLGIGVNTAIFSAAQQTFRPDIPFDDPDSLVRVYQIPESGSPNLSPRVPAFLQVRDGTDAFESVAASRFTDLTLFTDDGPERVVGNAVTPGWFMTLGVQPVLGRSFSSEEEALGADSRVVVMAHSSWQNRFGQDENIIGRTVNLNGQPHNVVGVMPPGFTYPYEAEFWTPFRAEDDAGDAFWALNIKARLREGATVAVASEELRALSRRIGGQVPGLTVGMTITPIPIRQVLLDGQGGTVTVLAVAVGLFLLVVCVNLANLILSRGLSRESEFALRASLGASRRRLLTQSLTESTVLGIAGGTAGIVVAVLGISLLNPLLPSRLVTIGAELSVSRSTFALASALAIVTGLCVGLIPALRFSSTHPAATLRRGSRSLGGTSQRLGGVLVAAELALTLILLTGVGLIVRDFQQRRGLELGYDPTQMTVFSVALDRDPYTTGEQRVQFVARLIEELQAAPSIGAAAATTMFPRSRGNTLAEVEAEGQLLGGADGLPINSRLVTPSYLEGLGASLLGGRWLAAADRDERDGVVVVNERLASQLWPGESALGKRARNRRAGNDAPWLTVVGIVSDVRESDEIPYSWYRPYAQDAAGSGAAQLSFWARSSGGVSAPSIRLIRDAMDRVDPELPIFEATTAEAINVESLARERQGAMFGSAFALFGLLLAALGVYGSVSYSVTNRTREFGIRMALGGDQQRILSQVLGRVAIMVAIGGAFGLMGAIGVAHVIGSQLVGVGPFDPIAFSMALVLLALTGLAAGALPAWRAMRVNPVDALRAD